MRKSKKCFPNHRGLVLGAGVGPAHFLQKMGGGGGCGPLPQAPIPGGNWNPVVVEVVVGP